jgi:hypothetical protein
VLVVHHCGRDAARGAGGHSSLRAETDAELEITRNGEDVAGSAGCLKPWEAEGVSRRTWYRRRGTSLSRCMVGEALAEEPLSSGADGANRP